MGPSFLGPLVLTVALGAVIGLIRVPCRPRLTVATLTSIAVAIGGCWCVVTFAVSSQYLLQHVIVNTYVMQVLPGLPEHHVDHWLGITCTAAFLASSCATALLGFRTWRRSRKLPGGLVVVPTDVPRAFSIAGKPGTIVVSEGMLNGLNKEGRKVLLLHEQVHLDLRHHRYLHLGDLACAALPLLAPLRNSLRHSIERWADERVVELIGSRRVVAKAIGTAALLQHKHEPSGSLAMTSGDVTLRVQHLVEPHSEQSRLPRLTLFVLLSVATLLAASVQFIDLAAFMVHLSHKP